MTVTVDPKIASAGHIVCPPECYLTEKGITHDCDVTLVDGTVAVVVGHEASFGVVGFGTEFQVLDGRPSWRTVTLTGSGSTGDVEVTDPDELEERRSLLLKAAEWLRQAP